MNFNLGKPILVMLVIALVSGGLVMFRRAPARAELQVTTFTESGYKRHRQLVDIFNQRTGSNVGVNIVQNRALQVRLMSAFGSKSGEDQLPDLVEIEINEVGKFFRPPLEEVGLLDLTDRIKSSGMYDQLVQTRFAPYTKEGRIFGVPSDVHPVVIAYRDDLFREAGIDLAAQKTWPDFHRACIQFRDYWRAKNLPQPRHAIELNEGWADGLAMMLLQQGINLVDDYNRIHINHPKVAQTMAFYVKMVAGPDKVNGQTAGGNDIFAKDVVAGNLCSFIAPDWRMYYVRINAPEAKGKLRVMPLPVFDPTDAPTSTVGGTMIGILKTAKDPDKAWELLQFLYFSDEALQMRRETSAALVPIRREWSHPAYHQPEEYFGGQKGTELYVELSDKIPPRYSSPATTLANATLVYVTNLAIDYMNTNGEEGLERQIQQWLDEAAVDLERRIKHWQFPDE